MHSPGQRLPPCTTPPQEIARHPALHCTALHPQGPQQDPTPHLAHVLRQEWLPCVLLGLHRRHQQRCGQPPDRQRGGRLRRQPAPAVHEPVKQRKHRLKAAQRSRAVQRHHGRGFRRQRGLATTADRGRVVPRERQWRAGRAARQQVRQRAQRHQYERGARACAHTCVRVQVGQIEEAIDRCRRLRALLLLLLLLRRAGRLPVPRAIGRLSWRGRTLRRSRNRPLNVRRKLRQRPKALRHAVRPSQLQ
eukprot:365326-Chlamydomonas_euryale.AAC.5